jgi:hypothetical protein
MKFPLSMLNMGVAPRCAMTLFIIAALWGLVLWAVA